MADLNVIIDTGKVEPNDWELFDIEGEETYVTLPLETTWPDVLVEAGVFTSKSQARKAGFTEIPWGWTDRRVGKLKTRFCIWKPSASLAEYE